jgi:hypothetical protein
MQEEYFRWRQYFYAACSPPGVPSVNNSQESFHKWLKDHGTGRKRMSTGAFLHAMHKFLRDLSHPTEHGAPFPECFTLSNKDWRSAQERANSTVKTDNFVFGNKNETAFCVPSFVFVSARYSTCTHMHNVQFPIIFLFKLH